MTMNCLYIHMKVTKKTSHHYVLKLACHFFLSHHYTALQLACSKNHDATYC